MCYDRVITPVWQVSTGDGDRPGVSVRGTVTKPVWFRVRGLSRVLKPNDVTE
jgi:hypothetical protein